MAGVLSNGQVIALLKTLPKDNSFGIVPENDDKTRAILKKLYTPLKKVFARTTSTSNAHQIESLKKLELSQRNRYPEYRAHIATFWESESQILCYLAKEEDVRTAAFLKSAYQLNRKIDEQIVLRRFVAIASYKLYQRAFPGPRIYEEKVKAILCQVHILNECDEGTENEEQKAMIDDYCEIIRRGQRERDFCISLAQNTHLRGEEGSLVGEEDNKIYGALFIEGIPDDIWKNGGLVKTDYKRSIEKLSRLWNSADKALTTDAAKTAKILLDSHAKSVVWLSETNSRKRPRSGDEEAHQGKKRCPETAPTSESRSDVVEEQIPYEQSVGNFRDANSIESEIAQFPPPRNGSSPVRAASPLFAIRNQQSVVQNRNWDSIPPENHAYQRAPADISQLDSAERVAWSATLPHTSGPQDICEHVQNNPQTSNMPLVPHQAGQPADRSTIPTAQVLQYNHGSNVPGPTGQTGRQQSVTQTPLPVNYDSSALIANPQPHHPESSGDFLDHSSMRSLVERDGQFSGVSSMTSDLGRFIPATALQSQTFPSTGTSNVPDQRPPRDTLSEWNSQPFDLDYSSISGMNDVPNHLPPRATLSQWSSQPLGFECSSISGTSDIPNQLPSRDTLAQWNSQPFVLDYSSISGMNDIHSHLPPRDTLSQWTSQPLDLEGLVTSNMHSHLTSSVASNPHDSAFI